MPGFRDIFGIVALNRISAGRSNMFAAGGRLPEFKDIAVNRHLQWLVVASYRLIHLQTLSEAWRTCLIF
jgi:hypothetical protein